MYIKLFNKIRRKNLFTRTVTEALLVRTDAESGNPLELMGVVYKARERGDGEDDENIPGWICPRFAEFYEKIESKLSQEVLGDREDTIRRMYWIKPTKSFSYQFLTTKGREISFYIVFTDERTVKLEITLEGKDGVWVLDGIEKDSGDSTVTLIKDITENPKKYVKKFSKNK